MFALEDCIDKVRSPSHLEETKCQTENYIPQFSYYMSWLILQYTRKVLKKTFVCFQIQLMLSEKSYIAESCLNNSAMKYAPKLLTEIPFTILHKSLETTCMENNIHTKIQKYIASLNTPL